MIEYRRVDRFPEPAFASLQRDVFSTIESAHTKSRFRTLGTGVPSSIKSEPGVPRVRIGAYDAGRLVGWSIGWPVLPTQFYMSNSGVVGSHQRSGIYSRLVGEMIAIAAAMGCTEIVSQHLPGNFAVLAAKTRLGFEHDGRCDSEEFGELVRLRYRIKSPPV